MSQAFPTPISEHDLACARALAEKAREFVAEAYRLLKSDHSLCIQAETAGKAVAHLAKSVGLRTSHEEQVL